MGQDQVEKKPFHCLKCPNYLLHVLSEWLLHGNKIKQKRKLVLLSCTHGVLTNHLYLHVKDSLFHCRLWQECLNMYQIWSCFISSHNTARNIKLKSVLLYSPQDAIELGGLPGMEVKAEYGSPSNSSKGTWTFDNQNLLFTDSVKERNSRAPREKWPFILFSSNLLEHSFERVVQPHTHHFMKAGWGHLMKPLKYLSHAPFLLFLFFIFLPTEHPTAQLLPFFPKAPTPAFFLSPFHFWLHNFLHNHLIYLPEWLFCVKEQQIKKEKPFEISGQCWKLAFLMKTMHGTCDSEVDYDTRSIGSVHGSLSHLLPGHRSFRKCSLVDRFALSSLLSQFPLPCCCLYSCPPTPCPYLGVLHFVTASALLQALAIRATPASRSHQAPPPSNLEVTSGSVPGSCGFSLVLPIIVWPWLGALLAPCRVRGHLERGITGCVLDEGKQPVGFCCAGPGSPAHLSLVHGTDWSCLVALW